MADKPNVYFDTIARLEPDIAMIDPGAFYASAAVSLKRIADSLEALSKQSDGKELASNVYHAISSALFED